MSTTPEQRDAHGIMATIAFGLDAEAFMGSTLGKYLTAKAQADMANAQEALLTVDPEDARAVRKLQNDAAIASNFLLWLGQAVTAGEIAQRELESRE